MGLDQWRDEQAWPLPDTQYVDYHLAGHGRANSSKGDGTLGVAPASEQLADRYLYDPRNPVPTVGGHVLFGFSGPADQAEVQLRDDVLVFSTPSLPIRSRLSDLVSATLFVSSSAVDTDFTAKLVDVFPDGRAILLCEGIQRMR